jgi:hypothetical protein
MFEEVPPARRGLAGLRFRRVVFGPFAIGGGLLLLAIGGSVAVAATVATVFTAASIGSPHAGNSDMPAHPLPIQLPATTASKAVTAGDPATAKDPASTGSATAKAPTVTAPGGPVSLPSAGLSWTSPLRIVPPTPSVPPAGSYAPTPTPAPTSSGPAGNALVYLTGYDHNDQQLIFQYATQLAGGGYQVSSPTHYHAGLAAGLRITSGGTLCPPAGSSCTEAQVIAAAQRGFFAEVALDPAAEFESITELDDAGAQAAPAPSPTRDDQGFIAPTASPSPSG